MSKKETIEGVSVYLAEPEDIPECPNFVGRGNELRLCLAAWGFNLNGHKLEGGTIKPLHFRLEGPPGVGKNQIVYEISRKLKMPLYMIQGHEDITAEDLALLLVPDPSRSSRNDVSLALRASPLATAIHNGGLFFFDEINRVPEKSLSPLASVLDERQYVPSVMTGTRIGPKDEDAKNKFRFCCALNPAVTETGGGTLPEFIEERTLPVIDVDYLPLDVLIEILKKEFNLSSKFLTAFHKWNDERSLKEISIRQALSFVSYALSIKQKGGELNALKEADKHIFRRNES